MSDVASTPRTWKLAPPAGTLLKYLIVIAVRTLRKLIKKAVP